jgi:hypothetical protein
VPPSDEVRWPAGRPERRPEPGAGDVADLIARGVRDAPPDEVPGRLCGVLVRLLPVSGASVSLRSDGVPVRLCASGERADRVAEIQATLGDGPCVHAARTGAPVLVRDLTEDAAVGRWPVYAQQAAAAGVRAVYALPLGSDTVCLGTLDLYRDIPGGLTDEQLRTAWLIAGVMTMALMALPHGEDDERPGGRSWLNGPAGGHDRVHQAVGMIMAQLGIGSEEALARLRGHAFSHGRTVQEAAEDVISNRRRLNPDD